MNKPFGKIPKPKPRAASDIAVAAHHVENSLDKAFEPDPPTDSDRFPRQGVDIPSADDAQEVIEEVNPDFVPVAQEQDEERHEGAVGGVVEGGIEYLAFYKSFRDFMSAPARTRWGIFFIKKRCFALATDMSFSTGESFADCLDALAAFLYTHELFHYRFDAHCLQMEATGGLPVYRPYRRRVGNLPIDEWHEESIANFYGLKAVQPSQKFPYPQPIYEYLCDLVANSPGAYAGCEVDKIIDRQHKIINRQLIDRKDRMAQQASAAHTVQRIGSVGLSNACSYVHSMVKSTIRTGMDFPAITLGSYLRLNYCPVYWIDWVKDGKSVLVPYAVSVAEISKDFIKRYLAGVLDHRSDHSFYRIDNGELVKLPNPHRPDLTNREFHNIIGQAGMTSPQFSSERKRTSVWRKNVPRSEVLPPRGRES